MQATTQWPLTLIEFSLSSPADPHRGRNRGRRKGRAAGLFGLFVGHLGLFKGSQEVLSKEDQVDLPAGQFDGHLLGHAVQGARHNSDCSMCRSGNLCAASIKSE